MNGSNKHWECWLQKSTLEITELKKNTVAMVFQIRTGLSLQRLRVCSAEMGCRELVGVIYYFAFIYIHIQFL